MIVPAGIPLAAIVEGYGLDVRVAPTLAKLMGPALVNVDAGTRQPNATTANRKKTKMFFFKVVRFNV